MTVSIPVQSKVREQPATVVVVGNQQRNQHNGTL